MDHLTFLDYPTLRLICWFALGLLLIGFTVMDGFDLGIAAALPYLGRTEHERNQLLMSIEPVWEGNQVWFILGGGLMFAAWPMVYAASFSGLYIPLFLVLSALIIRPVGFNFREKISHPNWGKSWDIALCIGGIIPSLVFGVAFGNLFLGLPFQIDQELHVFYTGSFWQLFEPFALLCGCLSLTMIVTHGAVYAAIKTEGNIEIRAQRLAKRGSLLALSLFTIAGLLLMDINGLKIIQGLSPNGPSNPLLKTVALYRGGWLANYHIYKWMIFAPSLAYLGGIFTFALPISRYPTTVFISSCAMITGIILTAGYSLFPFLMPSITNPNSSLTVWDASSSHLTLFIIFIATIVFLPIVITYTAWVFHVMRGKVHVHP